MEDQKKLNLELLAQARDLARDAATYQQGFRAQIADTRRVIAESYRLIGEAEDVIDAGPLIGVALKPDD